MGKLTALEVKGLTEPGRHGDGDGLYLHIAPSGSKSWVQRMVINGRRRDIGLGAYSAVGLAQARTMAASNRTAVSEGRDRMAEKHAAREAARNPSPSVPTFAEAAARVIALRRPIWSNPKHAAQWQSTLQTYALPVIGKKPVDEIAPSDALAVLEPIWTVKNETATRVRQRIETVMHWAVAAGHVAVNPAGRETMKALLGKPVVKVIHHRALPYGEVPAALRKVELSTSYATTKLALRLLALTATRSGEVRGMRWTGSPLLGKYPPTG